MLRNEGSPLPQYARTKRRRLAVIAGSAGLSVALTSCGGEEPAPHPTVQKTITAEATPKPTLTPSPSTSPTETMTDEKALKACYAFNKDVLSAKGANLKTMDRLGKAAYNNGKFASVTEMLRGRYGVNVDAIESAREAANQLIGTNNFAEITDAIADSPEAKTCLHSGTVIFDTSDEGFTVKVALGNTPMIEGLSGIVDKRGIASPETLDKKDIYLVPLKVPPLKRPKTSPGINAVYRS